MEIQDWYANNSTRAPHSLMDVMCASYTQMEQWHDWIQWAFPNKQASKAIYGAPVTTDEEMALLRNDGRSPQVMEQLLDKYKDFLQHGHRVWVSHPDHNWLRITRVIKALRLMGLSEQADSFREYCLSETKNLEAAIVNAWPYWAEA